MRLQPNPEDSLRNSPIAAVVLTNGDVDHIAGLLTLREGHVFTVYGSARILSVLAANSIFNVLSHEKVTRRAMEIDSTVTVLEGEPGSRLTVTPFLVPGKVALYLEDASADAGFAGRDGDTIGLTVSDGRTEFFYIPGCARIDDALRQRLNGGKLVFFDGTLYTDDEMIVQGLLHKTGQRMGHISMSGLDGSIAGLATIDIGRRVFIHINNSNPVLREDSAERRDVLRHGWEVAFDGMEVRL